MGSLNKVMLIGNLGKDPEVRAIPSGAKVANFSIATTENYNDKNGQRVEKTEWHNIVMWRGLAEVAEKYLKKGSQIYVEGRLQTRSWDDHNGQKRYMTEIVADNMVMLGRRDGNREGGSGGDGYQRSEPAMSAPRSQGGYGGGSSGSGGGFSGGSHGSSSMPPPAEDDLPF